MQPAEPTFPPAMKDVPAPPREMSQFASLALAMSTICILAGGITSFHVGFCSVGGAAIGIGWPIGVLFALTVALTMGQVASAFPRAGGPCEWAAELGGIGWGWIAGCFNLAGLITALAAVNVGFCKFVISAIARFADYDAAKLTTDSPWILSTAVVVTTLIQAFINHRGIRLTTLLTNFSGYLIIIVAAAMTLLLIICALISDHGLSFSRLVDFTNYSGAAGNNVLPASTNMAWLFALGLLLPAYTFTAFDASAQTAEETRDPETNVPKAIWQAVLISGVAGWIFLSALVLAAPDMDRAAAAGDQSFFWIVRESTPRWTHGVLYTGIGITNFLCGLACVTSASRLTWAMARDKGLPGARYLRRIGRSGAPSTAIWAVGIVGAFLPLLVSYETIASVCAVFFYLAYVVPTACGLATFGRWPRVGPWHLGPWYPPLAVVCVIGCVFLVVLGVQPPNEIALIVIPFAIVVLGALWFGRYRFHFRDEVTRALRKLPKFSHVHDVIVTPLGGGLTNRNYRVEIDGETYVLRISSIESQKLLIDRASEMIAAKSAAEAGVGPEIVDHSADYTVLLTRFVHGLPITTVEAFHVDKLPRITSQMRAIHEHPVKEGLSQFSPFETVRVYYRMIKELGVKAPAELDAAMKLLVEVEESVKTDDPHCLCHNDLLLGNFIDAGHKLHIIDWEYAGRGDRYFDLGNFAASLELSDEQERALLQAYFGEAKPEDIRRLKLMRLASDLRDSTWGFVQSAISKGVETPEHYLEYGARHLKRFFDAARQIGLASKV